MDIIQTLLRRLYPQQFGPRFRALVDALSGALSVGFAYLKGTLRESNPGTADATLRDWYRQLGIPFDSTLPGSILRRQARQSWTATGGQAVDALNTQIQIAFMNVFLARVQLLQQNMSGEAECGVAECEHYPSWYPVGEQDGSEPVFYYFVRGDIEQPEELDRLGGLLERIGPAEMVPVFDVDVLGATETSQAGVAVCNLAECNAE